MISSLSYPESSRSTMRTTSCMQGIKLIGINMILRRLVTTEGTSGEDARVLLVQEAALSWLHS